MTLTTEQFQRLSQTSGFAPSSLERVLRLLQLLDAIQAHPFLGPRVAIVTRWSRRSARCVDAST